MKLLCANNSREDGNLDMISAIKTVRGYTGMGLKEAKEAVEAAMEHGSVNIESNRNVSFDMFAFNRDLKIAGPFSVTTDLLELTALIEEAITVAVSIREYETAAGLINILPSEMHAEFIRCTSS